MTSVVAGQQGDQLWVALQRSTMNAGFHATHPGVIDSDQQSFPLSCTVRVLVVEGLVGLLLGLEMHRSLLVLRWGSLLWKLLLVLVAIV